METRDEDGMLESWLVRVSGRVQGIGYREACVGRARELGVTGWVRNRMDDSVEAMLQGSPEQLARFCCDSGVRSSEDGSRLPIKRPASRTDWLQTRFDL